MVDVQTTGRHGAKDPRKQLLKGLLKKDQDYKRSLGPILKGHTYRARIDKARHGKRSAGRTGESLRGRL